MIKSFGDKTTEKIFHGHFVKKISHDVLRLAARKLDLINLVASLDQLSVPPGNRLEKLSGKLSGYYSIRINDQYRIIFEWAEGDAYHVKVTDYHR